MADYLDIPPSKRFTRAEAAAQLDKSEKTIHRLIKAGKIRAEKRIVGGKNRWIINGSEITRYELSESGWFYRKFSPIPPLDGYNGFTLTFGTWGVPAKGTEQVSPRAFIIHEPDRAPTFELVVSLDDLCRFVRQRPRSKRGYEKLKNELRSRLRHAPEEFKIRFRLDNSTTRQLERIVKSVTPCRLRGVTAQQLQHEAIEHVVYKVLPNLWRAKKAHWTHYAKRAVKNFYRDKARQNNRLLAHIDAAIDFDQLTELDNISDPLEYSIASRANAKARKCEPIY